MNLGIGVMIRMLAGSNSGEHFQAAIGKEISQLELSETKIGYETTDCLILSFTDGTRLAIGDAGQSCCEARYMTCDDVLEQYIGATLAGGEVVEGGSEDDENGGDVYEWAFVKLETSKGTITLTTHNEHNGYYGGFAVEVQALNQEEE